MHLLIAPNAFKNSLSATEVAAAIAKGLHDSRLSCTTEIFPIGDGGDGTGTILTQKLNGTFIEAEVEDPLVRKIKASYGFIEKEATAIIELAAASGIKLLTEDEYSPLTATTFGTGKLIQQALERGAKRILIAVGGSATVDGGTGILQALGIRFLDNGYLPLTPLPAALQHLAFLDTSGLDPRLSGCEITVLCDVENKLLGLNGAAAVFGPQKGATPPMVQQLEAGLTTLKKVVLQQTRRDISVVLHGGAAGGSAAGLYGLLKATLVNGIDYFLELTNFEAALQRADLLITGEGSIDEQTLKGKGPMGIAIKAKEKGIPVIGLAGKVPLQNSAQMHRYFDVLLSVNQQTVSLKEALKNTAINLQHTAMELGNKLALQYGLGK